MSREEKAELMKKFEENFSKMNPRAIGYVEGYAAAMAMRNTDSPVTPEPDKKEDIA